MGLNEVLVKPTFNMDLICGLALRLPTRQPVLEFGVPGSFPDLPANEWVF